MQGSVLSALQIETPCGNHRKVVLLIGLNGSVNLRQEQVLGCSE